MEGKWIDLHTHTNVSDGALSVQQLIEKAIAEKVGVLAITDHNQLLPDFEKYAALAAPKLRLIQGTEVGCIYELSDGTVVNLHVVLLIPDTSVDLTSLRTLLARNGPEVRRAYINRMLDALRRVGIDLGNYDTLCQELSVDYIGKSQVAKAMVKHGFVKDEQEALHFYVGDFGEKRAWVEKDNRIELEELITVAHRIRAIPILAHLHYYPLQGEEKLEVLGAFRGFTGAIGAMETQYREYDAEQRRELHILAKRFGLLESAGSDFHGMYGQERLDDHFEMEYWRKMEQFQKEFYEIPGKYWGIDGGVMYKIPAREECEDEIAISIENC